MWKQISNLFYFFEKRKPRGKITQCMIDQGKIFLREYEIHRKTSKIEQVPWGTPRPCPSQISVGKYQRLPFKKIRSTGIAFGGSRFWGQVPGVGLILYSLACQVKEERVKERKRSKNDEKNKTLPCVICHYLPRIPAESRLITSSSDLAI